MARRIWGKINQLSDKIMQDHTGAYAAQSAFFFVLCMIPIILLLLTMVQYTSLTKADILAAVVQVFPKTVHKLIIDIVNQVYNQSRAIIPVTALVALWSAGKGVLSMTSGLNCVYDCIETRNYIFMRVRASFYTVLFIVAIVFSLILSVFGNSISLFINEHLPFMKQTTDFLIDIRAVLTFFVLTGFSVLIYRFLPNRRASFKSQLPGAVFTSLGWMLASFIFSMYLNIFKGFQDMYGSLTTIVLIMLWLYFCMYTMLLGGELNTMIIEYLLNKEIFKMHKMGRKEHD